MRTVGAGAAALTVLLAAAGGAGAKDKDGEPAAARADVVTLGFGWPQTLGAEVTYRWTRTSTGKPAQGVTVVGHMNVANDGEALRVEYRDWRAQAAAGAPDAPPNALQNAAPVVDKRGALVRVDGPAPALLKASAAHTWQMLVGSWAGVELQLGKEYEATSEGPIPVVPGGKLKTALRFRAERFLDCPGAPGVRCVELKLHSQPDRRSLAKLSAALLAQAGAKQDAKADTSAAEALNGAEEATLITEPARLIPHRLVVTKTVETRPTKEDPEGTSRVDRATWTFDYPPPAK